MRIWERIKMFFWHHAPPPPPSAVSQPNPEAEQARLQAEAALANVRSRRPEVERTAKSLQELNTRNGFGEAVAVAMQRRPRES